MKKIASTKGRLPERFKQHIPDAQALERFRSLARQGVNTVCLEARCPNWFRCLTKGSLAFMILGNRCTRSCQFCAIGKDKQIPLPVDKQEPYRILKIIKEFEIDFVIITSVTRDDLADYGAGQFARTINLIRNYKKNIKIEILIPDFLDSSLTQVVQAHPDVLAHNLETVPRLYPLIRSRACYQRSLQVLAQTKKLKPNLITKSSLLLGIGEEAREVKQAMGDLRRAGCDILVLGQYLAPSSGHSPIRKFISIEQFQRYKDIGLSLGFGAVLASALARTSYQAKEVYDSLACRLRNA